MLYYARDARAILAMDETKNLMENEDPEDKDMKMYVECIIGSGANFVTKQLFTVLFPLVLVLLDVFM